MDVEAEVARHYTHSDLTGTVLELCATPAAISSALTTADLAPVDEFHLGWRPQTRLRRTPRPPARHAATRRRLRHRRPRPATSPRAAAATVTGIDLTPAFVAPRPSSPRAPASPTVRASSPAAPLPALRGRAFDAATLIHVGMNIADKPRLFAEARRVLAPGGPSPSTR